MYRKLNSFILYSKKGISPIVIILMLIAVTVTALVMLNSWYDTFKQDFIIQNIPEDSVEIAEIEDGFLYVRNYFNQNFSINRITVNGLDCNSTGVLESNKFTSFNITTCLDDFPTLGPKEIRVYSDNGVYVRTIMLRSVDFIVTPLTPGFGNFSGYAWGENFGYVSMSGLVYGVNMKNYELYGHAYSENLGYISFNGSNYGVSIVDGVLTGNAYGEYIGYISFNDTFGGNYQVTFNGSHLLGYGYSENFGYLHFSNSPTYFVDLD